MAERVPQPGLPNEQPRPLPAPVMSDEVSPDATGAGAARNIQRVAGVAADIFAQAKSDADQYAVTGALGKAKQALNDIILDPEHGYYALHGADAMAGRGKAVEAFGKALNEAQAGLTNEDQRLHFGRMAVTIREQAQYHLLQHETHEQSQYAAAQFRGYVDQTMLTAENPAVVSDPVQLQAQYDALFQAGIVEARRRFGQNASGDAISSVVVPELQRAAYGTMERAAAMAEQGQNPAIAKQAFGVVGGYMVTAHQRQFAARIEALDKKAAVDVGAGQIMAESLDSVPVPGGSPIPVVDTLRFAASIDRKPADTPHLADIVKAAESRRETADRVKNAAIGTIFQRVETAALKGGPFDLSRPGVSVQDLEWLRMNAPGDLIKLQGQERKVDTAEAKAASADARSDLSADMANPGRRDFYMGLTVPEFTKMTVDQGLGAADRDKALKLFVDMLKGAQSEKVNRTVAEQLAAALPTQKDQRDKLQGPLFDKTNEFIEQWKAAAEGKGPSTDQIRTFVNHELVKGGPWYSRVRRISFETNPANAGTAFEPAGTDIAAPAPPARADRIPVVNGSGQRFTIPAGQVDDFLKSDQGKGFRRE